MTETIQNNSSNDKNQRDHENMAAMIWRRFRKHPGALVGAVVLTIIILSTILVPLSPYDPEVSDLPNKLQPPSWQHPFGTDALGLLGMAEVGQVFELCTV